MDSNTGFSPYEQVKIAKMSRSASGVAIAGLTVACAGTVAAVAGALWAGSKANAAKELAIAKNDDLRDLVKSLAVTVATERQERISGDTTISQTITDSISGQQSTSQSQNTQVDQAVSQLMYQALSDSITGRSSLNPTPVSLFSSPKPCGCPGCGCNQ